MVTRFLDAKFMGHAIALGLQSVYDKTTENLPKKKIIQISMDGPNVNGHFIPKLKNPSKMYTTHV